MWYESPTVLIPLTGLLTVIIAWIVAWLTSQKGKIDRQEKESSLASELRLLQQQAAIYEQQRANAQLLAEQTAADIALLVKRQETIATVLDLTHTATNSARTALETLLAEVRAQLKIAETEVVTLQTLHAAEQAVKSQRIDDLQRQLQALALQVLPTALPAPTRIVPP
jgi:Tfp pilus assembly protein PilO